MVTRYSMVMLLSRRLQRSACPRPMGSARGRPGCKDGASSRRRPLRQLLRSLALAAGPRAGRVRFRFSGVLAAGAKKTGPGWLGVGEAEVRELVQQVVVRLEAGRRDLAVAQPGKAHAVDVVGGDAAVGVGGGPRAV